MGILKSLRRVFGGGTEAESPAGQAPQRRSKTDQIRTLSSNALASAAEQLAETGVSEPGPLEALDVTCDERLVDITFALEPKHLAATVDGIVYLLRHTSIHWIGVNEGELSIGLHLPIPLETDGELRAVQALTARVVDERSAIRWRWLGTKYYRSKADCPYCFKAAMEIKPEHGELQPVQDGEPYATASCLACRRNFRYAYDSGQYSETESPDAL